jgi:hypothetical protein
MVKNAAFQPGFRFSIFDAVILAGGGIGTAMGWSVEWWLGVLVGFVVLHFFLFCNVFRVARGPELVWAGSFVLLAGSAIVFRVPDWWLVFTGGLVLSAFLIYRETRKPGYYGVGWRRFNPNLEEWWRKQRAEMGG